MRLLGTVALFCAACAAAPGQEQRFADLGDIKLASGETLRNCRIGYRTYGTPNAEKSNVVLFPTWAGGTTEQLAGVVGPGKSLGLPGYYLITVDALANGVSTSPSNSKAQPHMRFPKVTVRDFVETQHQLLTQVLGITHVKAVMGISMGGMQTFQWMVSYPDFMDEAIPMVGSPQLAAYDLFHWQAQLDAIENDPAWQHGDYTANPARVAEAEFGAILLQTPEYINAHTTRRQVAEILKEARLHGGGSDANDKIRQTEAMMALDVAEPFGGSLEQAASHVKARVLVIVARQDHVVTPGPALEFARYLSAPVITLEGNCGHVATGCESGKVAGALKDFLEK